MQDQYGRKIEYMRISVTDRCNLRCRYCMPEDIMMSSMSDILTYEEIVRVVEAAVSLGIVHFRLTGGEPLVRREIEKLVGMIKAISGVSTVTMTSNGVLLAEHAQDLKRAGLDGLNVSLDTLDKQEFAAITGCDVLEKVLDGITAAREMGLPVKLNAVEKETMNYDSLISFAQSNELLLRFIEMMPIGYGRNYTMDHASDIVSCLEKRYGKATQRMVDDKMSGYGVGPAKYYQFANLATPIGFIQAMSHKFCDTCNRIRLTAEGKLKICLCYDEGTDLRQLLRNGIVQAKLIETIRQSVYTKKAEHCFFEPENITEENSMISIGG